MSNGFGLRDYQEDAITSVMSAWAKGVKRPAVVLPTGSGKTVIFSHLSKTWHDGAQQRQRIVILVHRDELVNQTVSKLTLIAPNLRVGVVKAERNDVLSDVIVASIQTLRKPERLAQHKNVGLVIVDECHHAAADSYVSTMDYFENGGAVFVGFTATLVRDDNKELGKVWDEVVYTRDVLDLIALGHLSDVTGRLVEIDGMSLNKAKQTKGDFTDVSLSKLLLDNDAQTIVADAYAEHAAGRQGMIFAPSVECAQVFAESFNAKGIKTLAVWGAMPEEDRRLAIKRFMAGDVQVLSNCMIMTEGTDLPMAEVAVIARPTKSAGLYVQMVGRVLRPWPGKKTALVLDVVGASEEHDLATLADLSSRRVDKVEPGESLTGAAKRVAKTGHPGLKGYVNFRDVDLFNRSVSLWQKTDAGVFFISTPCPGHVVEGACDFGHKTCRNHLIFLWPTPSPEMFKVGVMPMDRRHSGGRWISEGVPLSDAMSGAEQVAGSNALTNRKSTWRRRNEAPTDAQLKFAANLKIVIPEDVTKPRLSDMITVRLASMRLDPRLPKG
jgi:superfamily II DNA or RNA helicase